MSLDLKHTEVSFLPNLTDSRCLRVAQVPRSRDMAIFVLTTTITTTITIQLITLPPCACARGNDNSYMFQLKSLCYCCTCTCTCPYQYNIMGKCLWESFMKLICVQSHIYNQIVQPTYLNRALRFSGSSVLPA